MHYDQAQSTVSRSVATFCDSADEDLSPVRILPLDASKRHADFWHFISRNGDKQPDFLSWFRSESWKFRPQNNCGNAARLPGSDATARTSGQRPFPAIGRTIGQNRGDPGETSNDRRSRHTDKHNQVAGIEPFRLQKPPVPSIRCVHGSLN